VDEEGPPVEAEETLEDVRKKSGESAVAVSAVSAEAESEEGETSQKKKRVSATAYEGVGGEDAGEFWSTESDDEDVVEVDDGFPSVALEDKSPWLGLTASAMSVEELGEGSYLDLDEVESESPPFTNLPVTTFSSTGPLDELGTELNTDMDDLQLDLEEGGENY